MNLLLLLDMASAAGGDGPAIQLGDDALSASTLWRAAWAASGELAGACDAAGAPIDVVAYVGTNSLAFPIALFGAAAAGVPFAPLNYRLSVDQLDAMLRPLGEVVVVADPSVGTALAELGHRVIEADAFVASTVAAADAPGFEPGDVPMDGEATAILLHTSGTTAAPKAAVLRHRHLTSYVIGTVEFGAADPADAVLVSVPAYHVAGLANLLSNLYAGRRIVYLRQFDADEWVATARREQVTNAMVVPTMLARICDVLESDGDGDGSGAGGLPMLRSLSYGGARTPATLLQRVMERLPDVGLTNAYGLTETSSTIAVLGPEDHRAAQAGDPVAIGRLSSAGKVLDTVELEVRTDEGGIAGADEPGEIWVRGEQVSGEYAGATGSLDADGWFPTRDRGWVDADGYLFIEGRSDDTIIRGGENLAPAEIEDALLAHADVASCAVVGIADDEWGQRIGAAVVLRDGATGDVEALRDHVRAALRSSKTPDDVVFVDALPYTETGKLLRRVVLTDVFSTGA